MKKFLTTLILIYATAIDGDSLMWDNKEIRLFGIDAPEYNQTCLDKNKQEYPCGQEAFKHIKKLLKKPIDCKIISKDKYKRNLAICDDINAKMVASGWAVSYYGDDFKQEEKDAKQNKLGIWQGKFIRPEFFRALHRNY